MLAKLSSSITCISCKNLLVSLPTFNISMSYKLFSTQQLEWAFKTQVRTCHSSTVNPQWIPISLGVKSEHPTGLVPHDLIFSDFLSYHSPPPSLPQLQQYWPPSMPKLRDFLSLCPPRSRLGDKNLSVSYLESEENAPRTLGRERGKACYQANSIMGNWSQSTGKVWEPV